MTELSLLSNQLKIQIRHLYLTGGFNLGHKKEHRLCYYRMRIITVFFFEYKKRKTFKSTVLKMN